MKKLIWLALLLPMVANAGLVPVQTTTVNRLSGSPVTNSTTVTLELDGEIRIANANLQNDAIELSASTVILLNGNAVVMPFDVPVGGSVVFPLTVGTYLLDVTVKGKPGGGVTITFYEDQPDVPAPGVGWELLNDGTVLHRPSGLIWHRKLSSPGIGRDASRPWEAMYPDASPYGGSNLRISEYIDNLNNGVYGTDVVDGNAGYTDWRAPTMEELSLVVDVRATPPFSAADGTVTVYPAPRLSRQGGMEPGEPLMYCFNTVGYGGYLDYLGLDLCPDEWEVYQIITNSQAEGMSGDIGDRYYYYLDVYSGAIFYQFGQSGSVWPVRGSVTP